MFYERTGEGGGSAAAALPPHLRPADLLDSRPGTTDARRAATPQDRNLHGVAAAAAAAAAAASAASTAAAADPQPFLQHRRLPSILLDSWEFRKLAPEGSVLANAMVSFDVDDDGVEEVIVGTTEGLLCVVKPDCRAPLFLRVLAATISVVLYAPGLSRLVLVTLEGQCEVIDHFLKPNHAPPHRGSGDGAHAAGSSSGFDEGGVAWPYRRTDSTNSLPRTSPGRSGRGGASTTSPHTAGRPLGPAGGGGGMSQSASHVSLADRSFVDVANSSAVQLTHSFHIPSNCLSADLSPDTDAVLLFLGSYDRRFYVYSILSGTCLLSLFVHDPITSIKAFAIPVAAADANIATASSSISVYGKRNASAADRDGREGEDNGSSSPRTPRQRTHVSASASTVAPGMLDDMGRRTTPGVAAEGGASRGPISAAAGAYVSLVFISTPTHLILLPGGLGEIQRWRKLQPKSAHLPLTVQLRSDDASASATAAAAAAPHHHHSQQQQGQAQQQLHGHPAHPTHPHVSSGARSRSHTPGADGRRATGAGGEAEAMGAAGVAAAFVAAAGRAPPSLSLRPPLSSSSAKTTLAGSGRAVSRPAPLGRSPSVAAADGSRGGAPSSGALSRRSTTAALPAAPNAATGAAVDALLAANNGDGGGGGAGGGSGPGQGAGSGGGGAGPLSTSQQRRQARRRAIQAAEMGRPVLVKPLWAMHLGCHAFDVPLLQTGADVAGEDWGGGGGGAAAAGEVLRAAASPNGGAARAPSMRVGSAGAGDVGSATRAAAGGYTAMSSSALSIHGPTTTPTTAAVTGMDRRPTNSSVFSVSSPSSASALHGVGGVGGGASLILGHHAPPSSLAGLGPGLVASQDRWPHRSNRDGGEDTEASYASPSISTMALGTASGDRRMSWRTPHALPQSQPRRPSGLCDSDDSDDGDELDAEGAEGDAIDALLLGSRAASGVASGSVAGATAVASTPLMDTADGALGVMDAADYGELDPYDGGSGTSVLASSRSATSGGGDAGEYDSVSSSISGSSSGSDGSGCSSRGRDAETSSVDPTLLARSLAHMRADSVPTMLLRRPAAAVDGAGGGAAHASPTCGTARDSREGRHASLVELAQSEGTRQRARRRRQHQRQSPPSRGVAAARGGAQSSWHDGDGSRSHGVAGADPAWLHSYLPSASSPTNAAVVAAVDAAPEVRLPTSIDVSVGGSQVALALSCEDGHALELRFSVVRLSALSRRQRRLPQGTVRLYDTRHPPRPLPSKLRADKQQHRLGSASRTPHRAASSPTSSGQRPRQPPPGGDPHHTTSGQHGSDRGGRHHLSHPPRRRRAPLVAYNIFLPAPTTPQVASTAAASSVPTPAPSVPLASPRRGRYSDAPRQRSRGDGGAGRGGAVGGSGTAAVAAGGGAVDAGSVKPTAGAMSGSGGGDGPSPASAAAAATSGPFRMQRGGDGGPSAGGSGSAYLRSSLDDNLAGGVSISNAGSGEGGRLVLRAQCRWAARLGDSPLVQRARVFCVREADGDRNTFCTVFVAANGTCYAVDGDTLSVVECSVKEDCSSFTLMAGPSSTTMAAPFRPLPTQGSATSLRREASSDATVSPYGPAVGDLTTAAATAPTAATLVAGGAGEGRGAASPTTSPLGFNLNPLSGAVGRTVSCVCVSVDELCVYSVGEANQLVQHRDCSAGTAAVSQCRTESVSLLSRLLPNRSCSPTNATAGSAAGPRARSRGAEASAEPVSAVAFMSAEEQDLLRQLAQRLRQHALLDKRDTGGEVAGETEEAALLRVREMLLHGYSEQNWERLQWYEHAVT